ncbi:MAG: glycosyltransferase family 1 protein [Patescibacteria group bacterium]
MIIGIDARAGAKAERAGKGEYVYQLVSHLIKDSRHQFILFLDTDLPLEWRKDNVRGVTYRVSAWLWQLLLLGYLELLRPVDVYLSTTSLILPALVRSVPVVTALMDFVSFVLPDRHEAKAVWLERMWMRPALRCSRKLIAISEYTKQDAVRLFGVSPEKITVTYLAASFSLDQQDYPLPYPKIILCVGTLEPRKNLERVVAAFNLIKPSLPDAHLVWVGRWGWQSEGIRQAVASSPFCSDIHILDNISASEKKSIYRQADVLVFPSLYEGFGLPPLEAMELGVPVVASRVSAIPEVVDEAGILIDPLSPTAIAEAIKNVLTDSQLAERLRQKGLERAKLFTWDSTAQKTLDVLQNIF